MNRVVAVARMQLVHPALSIGIPWAIVASSFAINLAIWGLGDVASRTSGEATTGGLASLYITVLVVFTQSVTQMFPFAMGLSLSRRHFYLGTALSAAIQSVGYGLALTVLAAIEGATGGWGMQLHFWAPGSMDVGNPVLQFVVFTVPMLACASVGIGIGVVFKRWGAAGLYALTLLTLLLSGAVAVYATWQKTWGDIWSRLGDLSTASVAIALPAAIAVAVGALAYLGLRRTVP
ncbi:hypothetical protein [Modestobacter altitudinis]|uniref:hypothetical protein n=1 Tax=Modestobacter altitudinis TaxID=2213158 RepID=UPI00110CD6E1|nr:hypothetical protein [Modestobacter altitudinis]